MARAAQTQDLRYLHESLQRQRVMNPLETGGDEQGDPYFPTGPEGKNAYYQRLREPARLRSFKDHVEGISGLPLDAIQLLFRSELPENELLGMKKVAAAIVKTEHDLHFWEPLEALGISRSFRLHRQALQEDLGLIQANCPPADRVALHAAWKRTFHRLEKAIEAAD
jgi:hypothetical protein